MIKKLILYNNILLIMEPNNETIVKMGGICFAQVAPEQSIASDKKPHPVLHDKYHTRDLMSNNYDDLKRFTFEGLETKAKVTDVYDGDTVTIVFYHNDHPIKAQFRLYGCDSPEIKPLLNSENRDLIIECGKIVRDKLSSLIKNKIVWIKFLKEEKYGRLMGHIYDISSQDIKKDMSGGGHTNRGIDEDTNDSQDIVYKPEGLAKWMIMQGYCKPYDGGRKQEFNKKELNKILKMK
jgi:endonuclease YncB( thermonuclease family)